MRVSDGIYVCFEMYMRVRQGVLKDLVSKKEYELIFVMLNNEHIYLSDYIMRKIYSSSNDLFVVN